MLFAHNSMLLVVDMQEKLLPAIQDTANLQSRTLKLAQAAKLLDIPVWLTEHWPEKIGHSFADLAALADNVYTKKYFNACKESDFTVQLPRQRTNILLAGTESHICVLQTGLGLAQAGFNPVLLADCIGSRNTADRQAALDRWCHYGLEAVTAEMAIYEWLETPEHPKFKEILNLVK